MGRLKISSFEAWWESWVRQTGRSSQTSQATVNYCLLYHESSWQIKHLQVELNKMKNKYMPFLIWESSKKSFEEKQYSTISHQKIRERNLTNLVKILMMWCHFIEKLHIYIHTTTSEKLYMQNSFFLMHWRLNSGHTLLFYFCFWDRISC
jgi:hypothetical protein